MDEEQRRPTSRLEQLPAELRDRIYCYLLGDAARIDTWRPLRDPALARTCRLLRAEVLRAAYRRALVTVRASSASTLPDLSGSWGHGRKPSGSRQRAMPWSLADWIADPQTGGAWRLQMVQFLTLVVDEESGYSGMPLPPRTYESTMWATALPALLAFFGARVASGAPRLRRLEVCVKGKKKCRASCPADAIEDDEARRRAARQFDTQVWKSIHQCGFADTGRFYNSFIFHLARGPLIADVVELQGIFPVSWPLALHIHRWPAVLLNYDELITECLLYFRTSIANPVTASHVTAGSIGLGEEEHRACLLVMDFAKRNLSAYFNGFSTMPQLEAAALDRRLRSIHSLLEQAWMVRIIESYQRADASVLSEVTHYAYAF